MREGGLRTSARYLTVTQRPNLPPVWGTSENSPYPGKQAHAMLPSEPVAPTTHRGLLCISRRASSPAAPPSHSPSPAPASPLPRRPSCPHRDRLPGAVYSAAPSDQAGALYGSFVPSEKRAPTRPSRSPQRSPDWCLRRRGKAVADTIAVPARSTPPSGTSSSSWTTSPKTPALHQQHHPAVPAGRLADRPIIPGTRPLSARCRFLYQSHIPYTLPPHIIYTPTALLDSSYTSQCNSLT